MFVEGITLSSITSLLVVTYSSKTITYYGGHAEVHLESSRTSMIKLFVKIVNDLKPLTISAKKLPSHDPLHMFDWVLNMPKN